MVCSGTDLPPSVSLRVCWIFLHLTLTLSALELRPDLKRLHQLKVVESSQEEAWAFLTSGSDPYLFLKDVRPESIGPEDRVLAFEYFCPDGISEMEIFFGPPIMARNALTAGPLMKSESWIPFSVHLPEKSGNRWTPQMHQLRLDLGRHAGVRIGIRNIILRSPMAHEKKALQAAAAARARKAGEATRIRAYHQADRALIMEEVRVQENAIKLRVQGDLDWDSETYLVEIPITWSPSKPLQPVSVQPMVAPTIEGPVTLSVPRFLDARDRLISRWAVARRITPSGWKLMSMPSYPTVLETRSDDPLKAMKTTSLKGMGGVWANAILDELVELGVRHVTVNMLISNMLNASPKDGWTTFEHGGVSWWVNPQFLRQHDRLIRFATEHEMVVSAILLVGFGNSEFATRIRHPEAVRAGHYAMPNLSHAEGAQAYAAAVDFLTRRYAQSGDPHGRISNWILHNEVDYGWVWTNMGTQPMEVYMDTYIRSMRLVYLLARRHNPHARVFISLTHHWMSEPDPSWKTYAPRRLLEWLAMAAGTEGDFEWGVAYHPYPQSLFDPQTWKDTLPTRHEDTPMITPKNLEVLDAFMQGPSMRYQGRSIRGVILSEQGFHTPISSEHAQEVQSAALIYTWQKMRSLKTIEAFHNHRWVDHPGESGLLLGLRSLPTPEHPYGRKKQAWGVYQKLETPDEAEAIRHAQAIIGKEAWKALTQEAP
ncbi:MAG: DUF5722 domain-containing protein [Verrucomicrobiota bacterium]|nr:DUF5722 domain-containing protein [Verrucomicrobiota bacterium]